MVNVYFAGNKYYYEVKMVNLLKPEFYVKNIYCIDFDKLLKMNIKLKRN